MQGFLHLEPSTKRQNVSTLFIFGKPFPRIGQRAIPMRCHHIPGMRHRFIRYASFAVNGQPDGAIRLQNSAWQHRTYNPRQAHKIRPTKSKR